MHKGSMSTGLGDMWEQVLKALRDVQPRYEWFNNFMSLGLVGRYRAEVIARLSGVDGVILDAGSGPGTMSRLLMRHRGSARTILVMLDPLREMLRAAPSGDFGVERVQGVFEKLPFRDRVFNCIITAFSLRDARDMELAISEFHRVLRVGGIYALLDIGKPRFPPLKAATAIYFGGIVPLMAALVWRSRWRSYTLILPTYLRLPRNDELAKRIAELIGPVAVKEHIGGVVLSLYAIKLR